MIENRKIDISVFTIVKVILVFIAVFVAWVIRDIIAVFIVALFFSSLLQLIADWALKYKIPRAITVIIIYILITGLTIGVMLILFPVITDQLTKITKLLITGWYNLSNKLDLLKDLAGRWNLNTNHFNIWQGQVSLAGSQAWHYLSNFFGGLAGIIIVAVLSFYLVTQDDKAKLSIEYLIPNKHRKFALNLIDKIQLNMGRWFLGQLFLSLIIGILYYLTLLIVGIPNALVLASLAGLFEFIPYLGPFLAAIPIILVAFTQSFWHGITVIIILVIIQQIENHILVPKVMQQVVGINPLFSVLSMLIGAKLFGFVGALLAIPSATVIIVLFTEWKEYSFKK